MFICHFYVLFCKVPVQVLCHLFFSVRLPASLICRNVYTFWCIFVVRFIKNTIFHSVAGIFVPFVFWWAKILSFNAFQWKLFSLVINVIFLFPFVLSFQFRETLHTLRSRNYSVFFPIDFKIVVLSKLNVESIWNRFYVWCNVGSKFVYINIWLTHLLTKHYYFPTALQFYICHKSSN